MARLLQIDPAAPLAEPLALAAAELVAGRLVAFPTETVYGLGANALDAQAVQRIFTAKGRVATNPLIVHVADERAARSLSLDWPPAAQRLAAHFWPGPLTIVVARNARIPDIVTAGGPTVALRAPAHPVALGLLKAAGLPIAAPSANRSLEVSPTEARHVVASLGDAVDLVLDGGPTTAGIESTVIDITRRPLRVLRPGPIRPSELAACLEEDVIFGSAHANEEVARSPGQQMRHYAPRARVECLAVAALGGRFEQLQALGRSVGQIHRRADEFTQPPRAIHEVVLPDDAAGYAAGLYAALRHLDDLAVDVILVAEAPATEPWLAVRDRLSRASASPHG